MPVIRGIVPYLSGSNAVDILRREPRQADSDAISEPRRLRLLSERFSIARHQLVFHRRNQTEFPAADANSRLEAGQLSQKMNEVATPTN